MPAEKAGLIKAHLYRIARQCGTWWSLKVARATVFYSHVFEFTGFKNLAAFEAFHEFGVLLTGHNLYTGMLTLIHFASLVGGW